MPNIKDFKPEEIEEVRLNIKDFAPEDVIQEEEFSEGGSAFAGGIKGMAFGFDDEIAGGLEAAGSVFGVKGMGGDFSDIRQESPEENKVGWLEDLLASYQSGRDKRRGRSELAQAQNPKSFTAGEVGGGIATSLAGPGGAAAKYGAKGLLGLGAAEGAAYGAGTAAELEDVPLEMLKGGVLGLAGAGAGVVAGKAINKTGNALLNKMPKNATQEVAEAAAQPQTISVAARGAGEIAEGGGSVMDDVAEAGFDYTPMQQVSNDILDEVPSEKPWSEIASYLSEKYKGGISKPLVGLRKFGSMVSRVDDDQAQRYLARRDQINAIDEGSLVDDVSGQINKLKEGVTDAKYSAQAAKIEKRSADRFLKEDLKRQNVPEGVVDDLNDSLSLMRKKTSEGSAEGYSKLMEADRSFKLSPIKTQLTKELNKFKINGAEPPKGLPGYDRLTYYRSYLDQLSENSSEIAGHDLKTFIRFVDDDLSEIYAKAQISGVKPTKGEMALKDFRRNIDSLLKKIPEYKEVMAGVADDTQALKAGLKHFGGSRARPSLERLSDPKNIKAREALEAIDGKTGKSIIGELSEYEKAKALLDDPALLRSAQEGLPETLALRESEAGLAKATQELGPIRSVNSPQSLVRRGGNPKANMKEAELIKYLDAKRGSGDKISDSIDDLATQRSFSADQSGGRGHRWAVTGGIVGGFAGGPIGASVGATLGASADKYGGKAFKGALDLYLDKGAPIANQLQTILEKAPDALGSFAKPLQSAAQRGQQALGATHYVLWKNNPEYRQTLEGTVAKGLNGL